MAIKIKLRGDTAANWTSKNPILDKNEIGVEEPATTNGSPQFKRGDGVTRWSSLGYMLKGDTPEHEWNGTQLRFKKADGTWGSFVDLKGLKGDTGTAASIYIGTVTTGAPGTEASITNAGNSGEAVFDFVIPRGTPGEDGTNGISFSWKGAYDAGTAYLVNDTVSYNGSSYICILASTGNLPTNATYWTVMAQKGTDGTGSGDMSSSTYDTNADGVLNTGAIPNLDASKITSGTIDISRLPASAIERLVPVANQTARYALTTATVQLGDTVKENDTGLMFMVIDEANLGNAAGYQEYTAGAASAVPYTGVTSKPTNLTDIAGLTLTGNGGKAVVVNAGGTALELGTVSGGSGGGGYTGITLQMTRPNDNEDSNQVYISASKTTTTIKYIVPPCVSTNIWVMRYVAASSTWVKMDDVSVTGNYSHTISSTTLAVGDYLYTKINGVANNIQNLTVEIV